MGGLFGGDRPKPPKIEPPAPLPDEEATKRAASRKIARERSRSGALATILSSGDRETLGG